MIHTSAVYFHFFFSFDLVSEHKRFYIRRNMVLRVVKHLTDNRSWTGCNKNENNTEMKNKYFFVNGIDGTRIIFSNFSR